MHRLPLLSALPAGLFAASLLAAPQPARAQAESREGIYLQNQILELRQELDQLRAGGGARMAPPIAAPRGAAPAAGSNELLSALLDRVSQLEEEVRRLRGRMDESDYRTNQTQQNLEKLQGDMDYRLGQLDGSGGTRPAAPPTGGRPLAAGNPPPPIAAPPAAAAPPAQPPAQSPVRRPPERAISEGQAALARRDYATAEAAAREVLAQRNSPRAADAQLLLADALLGKRDYGAAAVAFDDAYKRGRSSPRAPDALLGLANAFIGLNSKREACETLDELRSNFGQQLRGSLGDRATEARRRAGCR
jgi:TolA-binding protein